ncbi:unnamed protein product [Paramecium octaurelia]|uniref:Uncharacterized protein n=1 Tax=Paramecium octaurelia TaxID=43137 RepID=A0A8S1VXH8_PAROT|nr:unnamed protein product [Paramecium octaurelia]
MILKMKIRYVLPVIQLFQIVLVQQIYNVLNVKMKIFQTGFQLIILVLVKFDLEISKQQIRIVEDVIENVKHFTKLLIRLTINIVQLAFQDKIVQFLINPIAIAWKIMVNLTVPQKYAQCVIIHVGSVMTLGPHIENAYVKPYFFDDQTNNIQCLRCHYSCVLCSNSIEKDTCLQCPETRQPSDPQAIQCECVCSSSNYFDDGFSLDCQQCDWTCQTCYGPYSSNCLTCDLTYRQLVQSSFVCSIGYYEIGQLECAKCYYSCQQCFDNAEEDCIVCSLDLHFRQLKGNTCKCIDGYQEQPGLAQCKKCSYKACSGLDENNCFTCDFLQIENQKKMNANVNYIILNWKFRNAQCILLQTVLIIVLHATMIDIQLEVHVDALLNLMELQQVHLIIMDWLNVKNVIIHVEHVQEQMKEIASLAQILIIDTKQEIHVFVKKDILMQDYLFVKNAVTNVKNAIGCLKVELLVWITGLDNLCRVLIDANAFKDIMMMDKMKFVKDVITHVSVVVKLILNANSFILSQIEFIMIKTFFVIVILDIMIMDLKIVINAIILVQVVILEMLIPAFHMQL